MNGVDTPAWLVDLIGRTGSILSRAEVMEVIDFEPGDEQNDRVDANAAKLAALVEVVCVEQITNAIFAPLAAILPSHPAFHAALSRGIATIAAAIATTSLNDGLGIKLSNEEIETTARDAASEFLMTLSEKMRAQIPLRGDEYAQLSAATSEEQWNAACDEIKKLRGGVYPPDWIPKVNPLLMREVTPRWENSTYFGEGEKP